MGSTQEEDRKLCVVNRKCTATFKWKPFLYEHSKREKEAGAGPDLRYPPRTIQVVAL